MRFSKRLGALLVAAGGAFGTILCLAAIAAAWLVAARLSDLNEFARDGIGRSSAAVHARLVNAQQLVARSKITSENVRQSVTDWTKQTAAKRVATKLDIQTKADQLDAGLAEIDRYLEVAGAAADGIHGTIVLARKLGVRVDEAAIDPAQTKLAALRLQISEASETLADIRRRVADVADGEPLGERAQRIVQLALRIVATVGEIDNRLAEAAQRLVDTQARARESKANVNFWILVGQFVVFAAMAWLALGQAVLAQRGWNAFRQHGPPTAVNRGSS